MLLVALSAAPAVGLISIDYLSRPLVMIFAPEAQFHIKSASRRRRFQPGLGSYVGVSTRGRP